MAVINRKSIDRLIEEALLGSVLTKMVRMLFRNGGITFEGLT